jgi:hypothetical protein
MTIHSVCSGKREEIPSRDHRRPSGNNDCSAREGATITYMLQYGIAIFPSLACVALLALSFADRLQHTELPTTYCMKLS